MNEAAFIEDLKKICARDPRYPVDAYLFIREALDYTTKALKKPRRGPARHISGTELLGGIRSYALEEYGPLARTVLQSWGIERTDDFGNLVFNLVEAGKLGKTDEDKKEDFAGGFDFDEAFTQPFLPKRPVRTRKKTRRRPPGKAQD